MGISVGNGEMKKMEIGHFCANGILNHSGFIHVDFVSELKPATTWLTRGRRQRERRFKPHR